MTKTNLTICECLVFAPLHRFQMRCSFLLRLPERFPLYTILIIMCQKGTEHLCKDCDILEICATLISLSQSFYHLFFKINVALNTLTRENTCPHSLAAFFFFIKLMIVLFCKQLVEEISVHHVNYCLFNELTLRELM